MTGEVQPILVPWLQGLVEKLEFSSSFGSFCSQVSNVTTSAPKSFLWTKTAELGDQFNIILPFADGAVKWVFLFCWDDPSIQPEIELPEDPDFEADFAKFSEWDPSNPDMLYKWCLELSEQFNQCQKNLCYEHDALAQQLADCSDFDEQSLEIRIHRSGKRCGEAVFMVDLQIKEVAHLPVHPDPDLDPADDMQFMDDVVIVVGKFKEFGDGKAEVEVLLNPFINQLMTESSAKMPEFRGSFAGFAMEVSDLMKSEVQKVLRTLELRSLVICHFLAVYDEDIIEFDSNTWLTVAILNEDVTVKVVLPDRIGRDSARVEYISNMYHKQVGGRQMPYNRVLILRNLGAAPMEIFNSIRLPLDKHLCEFIADARKYGV